VIRLIAIDVDGTLLDGAKEATRAVMREWRLKNGIDEE
jgi:hydroxymethylpyrimidine pyrophosphatase-like HAD family hydrolase